MGTLLQENVLKCVGGYFMDGRKEDGLTLKAIDSDHLAKCWYHTVRKSLQVQVNSQQHTHRKILLEKAQIQQAWLNFFST